MTLATNASARLRAVSARHLHLEPGSLIASALLTDDLGLDSLAAIEWGMVIEDELGLQLPDDAWTGVMTYGDVEELVRRAGSAAGV